MQKALIAHSSEEIADALSQMLAGEYEVITCADGITALQLLKGVQPQILLLDLTLPCKDGFTLLQDAAQTQPRFILAFLRDRSDYVLSSAQNHGIDELLLGPYSIQAVAQRLTRILHSAAPQRLETEAAKLLLKLGFTPGRDGFTQLRVGIPLYMRDPCQRLCKELYPAIAAQCSCASGPQVEHSIRTIIHDSWESRNELWEQYFPGQSKAPTNRKFISRMASELLQAYPCTI